MNYPIPQKTLQQNIIVLGKTGAGKSSAARSIVEPMLKDKMPVCILDPKGDWWGIKLSADGKRAGFPLVIFGGKHADVPINARSGADIAELFATGNRPCLIDLRGWMPADRSTFFTDFASTLFQKNIGRKWLIVDECHNFAPKGKVLDPLAGKSLHWANRLASEGRGLGVNLIGLSQRPQKVHNDFLTSCETLIALRVLHKSDRTAYYDWIEGCGDQAKAGEMLKTIANLKRGRGWVWSPEIEFGPELVTFPMFKTYDSFKPQEAGDAANLTGWASVNLDDVKQKLARVIDEHKANDPVELRKRVRELERQLAAKPSGEPWITQDEFAKSCDEARTAGFNDGTNHGYKHGWREHCAALSVAIESIPMDPPVLGGSVKPQHADPSNSHRIARKQPPAFTIPKHPSSARPSSSAGEALPRGEATTLAACIQFPAGLRREQLTVLTAYKRSSRDTYIQRLRERGYVETSGDRVIATDDGVAAMPDCEPLPTGEALQQHWLAQLPEGEKRILGVLIDAYPESVARTDLDEKTGYQRSSRDTYLQRMRAKQLITEPGRGEVRASDDLF